MELHNQLLAWVADEIKHAKPESGKPVTPIHLLLVKTALMNREATEDRTASIELSLQIYERASVYRALREMFQQGLIAFTERDGTEMTVDDKELRAAAAGEKSNIKYLTLTEKGAVKAKEAAGD